jgi:ERF superfamily
MSDFIKKVAKIQATLKAPKNQRNNFGNYNYRNAEDIMEAVKPLLGDLVLTVNDELVFSPKGDTYIKSTATITDGTNSISNSALAREAMDSKGMSASQMTGSTSSYARKYALNGLFLIDDTRDDDATNTHGKEAKAPAKATEQTQTTKPVAAQAVANNPAGASAEAVKPTFKRPVKPQPKVQQEDEL